MRLSPTRKQPRKLRCKRDAAIIVILLSTDTKIRAKEVNQLRQHGVIFREYVLEYDPKWQQTNLMPGYFW